MTKQATLSRGNIRHTLRPRNTGVSTVKVHSTTTPTKVKPPVKRPTSGVSAVKAHTAKTPAEVIAHRKPATGGYTARVTMRIPVIVTCNHSGYFFAELPVIKGYSEGRTREEALDNIRQVIRLCLMRASDECDSVENDFYVDHVEIDL